MEEKVLFNVLREIRRGGTGGQAAPDDSYLKALETVGYVKRGWDTCLTEFGRATLDRLERAQWR